MKYDELGSVFGAQLRAGKPLQRNPPPISCRKFSGLRARVSRWLRRIFGEQS